MLPLGSRTAKHTLGPLVLCLLLGALPSAFAQDRLDSAELKRYRSELLVEISADLRRSSIENIAFYQDERATQLLLGGLSDSLVHLESLEQQRATNEAELMKILGPQLREASPDNPMINYAGTEEFQTLQRQLGDRITGEEGLVRTYRDALARTRESKSILALLKLTAKKPERLRLVVLDALGAIDDGRVTEKLIERLSDRDQNVQLAAAEALARHDRARVPVTAYGALLQSEAWQVREAAIDALGRLGGPDAVALLIERMPDEKGRELAEIAARLEIMTGQTFGKNPLAWKDWWLKSGGPQVGHHIVLQRPVLAKGDGAEYWGIRIDSLRVLFVIDISGTMQAALVDYQDYDPPPGEARLDLARREIKSAIGSLSTDAWFNLIAYNDIVLPWQEQMQKAEQSTKEKAYAWLDRLVAISSTNIFDALEMAFHMARPGNTDKYYKTAGDTILFLSDGGPTAGRSTDCDEILAQVAEWNRTAHLTIHVIGIGKQLNRQFLLKLAEQNGGVSRFIE